MRSFIAGGTGAIGRPLMAELLARGHSVVALTRSHEKALTMMQQGIEPVIADVFDVEAVQAAVCRAKPEVVIEQLTALPATYTPESMSIAAVFNRRIRLEGGANVLAAALRAGVRRYLRQSVAFYAASGRGLANEDTPLAIDASPAVAADSRVLAEVESRLLGIGTIEGIVLRYGFFYGPGTWFDPSGDVAGQLRRQEYPIVGDGEGVWSWLHVEDAAVATALAVERGKPGIYIVADDQPLAVREWIPAFAQFLHAPQPPRMTVADALNRHGGEDVVYYGTMLRGASNAKVKRELKFQPRPLEWTIKTAVARAG